MSDLEPFPELIEGRRLNAERINGVDPARLTIGAERDAVVTFRDEVAAFENVLGVYLIDPDGTIRDPEIVFARIEHADPIPGLPGVRPGGGPLEPGAAVHLNTLYPAADLEPGQQFGLFVVADGADRNPTFLFDGSGSLEFVNTATGAPANIADDAAEIALRHIADDGTVRTVQGDVFHTADNDPDRLENNLNPGGAERVVSGADATSGALLLGFEDLRDFDFNDVVVGLGPIVVPPPVEVPPASLADLDGTNGFRLDAIDAYDFSNVVAGAGDVNGDGFEDVIVGAEGADHGGSYDGGESYVVFGRASGFGPSLDLAILDGTNGFRLDGVDSGDRSGGWVASAGDVNGDGFADIHIAASFADPGGVYSAGESYVVFGRASGFGASFDLASLDGTNGFRLDAIEGVSYVGSAGDINGDGFAEVTVGAHYADTDDGDVDAGETYLVFGRASGFTPNFALASLDGTNGFRVTGIDPYDLSDHLTSAGDIDGDGFGDLVVAAFGPFGPAPGGDTSGEAYVVFGHAGPFEASLDLAVLDGTNGFRLDGIDPYDGCGQSVASAGDVNGDGFADVIVGAPRADADGNTNAGESYVVFGNSAGFGASFDLASLDGTNGFRLDGIAAYSDTGASVAGAGDVNGDGFDDVVVGAQFADPGGVDQAGESYVIFGRASGFDASLDLASLDGTNGFQLNGIEVYDHSGATVAGDVDGDGFGDLAISASRASPGGDTFAGESYVVFGGNFTGAVSQLGGPGADTLAGTSADDVILGAQGDDTLLGNGGLDILNGGADDDILALLDPAFLEGFGTGGGRMLGGTGSDTLRLDGSGVSLDLGAIPDTRIQGVERVDLGGDGNTLALDLLEILNVDDASNELTVLGDDSNAVSGGLPGATEGTTTVGGVDFATFTLGAAELLVQTGVDTGGIDTAAV